LPSPIRLIHSKLQLALHELRGGAGRALLWLHGLGERAPATAPEVLDTWPGPIMALDFTGHGASSIPAGGGYTAEVLMGDADAALAYLEQATLVGRGLGAYIALLLAGARPGLVRGAVLCDGPGLAGGGARPGSPQIVSLDRAAVPPPDPFALVELTRDVRPPEYATAFARQAAVLSGLARPITVCALERAAWLRAVAEEPGVEESTIAEALVFYASVR